jgi:hypothetical protein
VLCETDRSEATQKHASVAGDALRRAAERLLEIYKAVQRSSTSDGLERCKRLGSASGPLLKGEHGVEPMKTATARCPGRAETRGGQVREEASLQYKAEPRATPSEPIEAGTAGYLERCKSH